MARLALRLEGLQARPQILDFIKQIERKCHTGRVQAQIALESLRPRDPDNGETGELPVRSAPPPTGSITPCSTRLATHSASTLHARQSSSSVHIVPGSRISEGWLEEAWSVMVV
jgi:hypothetical protein